MTKRELRSELFHITKNWQQVDKIFYLFGKLAPEPTAKPQVPAYDLNLVRRVGRQKLNFTSEQKLAAREILRKLGLI